MTNETSVKLNLSKLTRGYLFPTIEQLAQEDFQFPLYEELCFIGTKNVQAIHMYLRQLERGVCNQIDQHTAAIHTILHLQADWAISSRDETFCDWHGAAHAKPTEKMRRHYYNELHSPEGYEAAVRSLEAEVYSCRLGSIIASWCSANPQPCEFLHNCLKPGAVSPTNPADFPVTPCPHYEECHSDMPFTERRCIFADLPKDLIHDCRKDLERQREDLRTCKENIKNYHSRLKTADFATQSQKINTPEFTLDRSALLHDAELRSKVVELDRAADGAVMTRWGVYAGEIKTSHGFCKVVNLNDGDSVRIFERGPGEELRGRHLYLTENDFTYLVNNPEYRKVWTRLTGSQNDFHTYGLDSVFENY